jgi:hypothetical protein
MPAITGLSLISVPRPFFAPVNLLVVHQPLRAT